MGAVVTSYWEQMEEIKKYMVWCWEIVVVKIIFTRMNLWHEIPVDVWSCL